jgi:5-(aminomethyl)-3-furanmethanol phosphate kinase
MIDGVVIKVGGSLFSEPGAMSAVREWLAATRRPDQMRLLVAGGGQAAESLRRVDRANPLGDAVAHWAAVEMMDTHAGLLAEWFPGTALVDDFPGGPGDHAFRPWRWLREAEPGLGGERLTVGWQTTSDAIAARVAVALGAGLVLLKHTLAATYDTLAAAAEAGIIDPETPRIAGSLKEASLLGVVRPGLRAAESVRGPGVG